jgi:hypothetical protein
MNDKKKTPYRIGYAPDDFPMNRDELVQLIVKQNISKHMTHIDEILNEMKRQTLVDFTTHVIREFTNHLKDVEYMDLQVGVGTSKGYFRVVPVVTHFLTDNVQAIELCSVNKDNCRMCLATKKDFGSLYGCEWSKVLEQRDLITHRNVCKKFSELRTIKLKNSAQGHNVRYLSADVQMEIEEMTQAKTSLGVLPCDNKIFDIPHPITFGRGTLRRSHVYSRKL